MTHIFLTMFCMYIWVMPGTENNILPHSGCYYCCDNGNWIIEPGECRFMPQVTDAWSCVALNQQ